LTTPAAEEGISIEALSDSTVISDCSSATASPGLTSTSMTLTSLKSPMSGTRTSMRCAAAGATCATATGAGAGTGAASTASVSSTASNEPSLTLSPSATLSSRTVPACDEGISIEALSDSTVTSDWSTSTRSPTLTSSSMTATSLKSPMSGTFTSTSAMCASPDRQA
jgi:hypothetical protein